MNKRVLNERRIVAIIRDSLYLYGKRDGSENASKAIMEEIEKEIERNRGEEK